MKKYILLLIMLFLVPHFVKAEEIDLVPNAGSAIMVEVETGTILFEKNANERLAPASMTKMMSLLLIFEAIEKGVMDWDEEITISAEASGMGGSQILLETGEKMTVYDLVKGIAVASGNDATVALAQRVAGTEDAFVNKMNEKVKQLGLKNTNFMNSTGLDEEGHYSSSYDMMIIAKELAKHEKIFEFSSIYEDYLREGTDRKFWLVNTNKLVRFYNGADGLKTGYTSDAGYCLTATAKRNDMRLLAVIMKEENSNTRNKEMMSLLDYGFNQYETEKILTTSSRVKTIQIDIAKDININIVPKKDVTMLYKKSDEKINPTFDIKLDKIKLPILKGDTIGKIIVKENDKVIKEEELTVDKDVKKANILTLFLRNLNSMLSGKISF